MIRKYASYKESGIKWMGKIPSHWLLTKNRYGFKKHNNGKNEKDDTPVLSLTTKGLKVKTNLSFGKSTESYIGHQLVEKGDIVFTPRDFDQTPILSDVSNYDGCISNLYIVDKVKKVVLNYFVNYYWYGLKYSVNYFKNFSHGIRYSFNRFQFDEIPLLIPPISEQKLISRYLDKKTEQIGSLVDKIQRKIELLQEQRTTLINNCVTKGLDPNVELKDSGVEWIGDIPKHWNVTKLKYHGSVLIGLSFDKEDIVDQNEGTLVLRSSNVQNGEVSFSDNIWVKSKVPENLFVQTGDILICSRNGSRNLIGKNCLLGKESLGMTWGVFMSVFRTKLPNFFHWMLNSQVFKSQSGLYLTSTINQLTVSTLENLKFPYVADPIEQQKIHDFLSKKISLFDKLIKKENDRIILLKEYRQSLISSVVTGKVRVMENMT